MRGRMSVRWAVHLLVADTSVNLVATKGTKEAVSSCVRFGLRISAAIFSASS